MKFRRLILYCLLLFPVANLFVSSGRKRFADDRFVSYIADPKKQDIRLYWKDGKNQTFGSIKNLKSWVEKNNKDLVFAMNAGMYKPHHSPVGLYIEHYSTLAPLDTLKGDANFYLEPNGVFYLTAEHIALISTTANFHNNGKVKYATQSGPMLVIDGEIHPAFKKGSGNLNIRNGVGILPGNKVVFAMSKSKVSFYAFATYFKNLGCRNALYLDGFVSQTYLPEKKWIQTGGDFGPIIGITASQ